jgi:hypothetical protein
MSRGSCLCSDVRFEVDRVEIHNDLPRFERHIDSKRIS